VRHAEEASAAAKRQQLPFGGTTVESGTRAPGTFASGFMLYAEDLVGIEDPPVRA